jgi:RNA polymerase subunit RPABC4/transcription elongation factor Spt4
MEPNQHPVDEKAKQCPTCRTPLQHLPALEGEQERWLCPHCDLATGSLATELPGNGKVVQRTSPYDPRERFRWLLETAADYPPDSKLPEWIIEDLPEDVQELLREDLNTPKPNLGPKLSDALTSALRDQGYVIEEDSGGIRLGGDLNRLGDEMSPYDVVRMAADLDGGMPSPEELRRCSKCEAVLPPEESRCSWCGTDLTEAPHPEDEAH